MSTIIRAKISSSNPYYISKHRYYELKHHCLQYPEWKQKIVKLRTRSLIQAHSIKIGKNICLNDETYLGLLCAYTTSLMDRVEKCCEIAGGDIANYIFQVVTQGKSYSSLNPPCGKEYFYKKKYRKFFWILDKEFTS